MSVSISSPNLVRTYYTLTKPGIIYGNVVTAAGGFALASKGVYNFALMIATLLGLSLIIASACVFNNYIDRDMDQKMGRTKDRALAKGLISAQNAILFAIALAVAGISILSLYVSPLALSIALIGFLIYVVFYSLIKYRSVHATLIGSFAGAVPPVVGYCAVSNTFDLGAVILFAILVLWQMPHFFAIAMYRIKDYTAAAIPVLPIKSGIKATKIQMLLYIIGLIIAATLLTIFGYTGYIYLSVAIPLGFAWLWLCIQGFKAPDDTVWARKMFIFSLVVITFLSAIIAVDGNPSNAISLSTTHHAGAP